VYVALVTDLYSKKVMGYKMDDNMKVTLVKDALTMASFLLTMLRRYTTSPVAPLPIGCKN
jgi:transposase InsO family protein